MQKPPKKTNTLLTIVSIFFTFIILCCLFLLAWGIIKDLVVYPIIYGSSNGPEFPNDPQGFNNDEDDTSEVDPRGDNLDPCIMNGGCDYELQPDDLYYDADP